MSASHCRVKSIERSRATPSSRIKYLRDSMADWGLFKLLLVCVTLNPLEVFIDVPY